MQLIRRIEAAQAAIDGYHERDFKWGSADCVHLVAASLTTLGYENPLADVRHYSTLTGARRALKRTGHKTLIAAVDAIGLERIAPAAAMAGDIVSIPSDDPRWTALGVVVGDNRILCFADEGAGFRGTYLLQQAAEIAWRAV